MAKIKKIQRTVNGVSTTEYPVTIHQAVVDVETDETLDVTLTNIKNVLHATKPNEPLVFRDGIIHSNGNFVLREGWCSTMPISVNEGQKLWILQTMTAKSLYLAAYDKNGSVLIGDSLEGYVSTTTRYSYTVPLGVKYIVLSYVNFSKSVGMVTLDENPIQWEGYEKMLINNDLSDLEWIRGAIPAGTPKVPRVYSTSENFASLKMIPTQFLEYVSISNNDGVVDFYLFDKDFEFIRSEKLSRNTTTIRNFKDTSFMMINIALYRYDPIDSYKDVGLVLHYDKFSYLKPNKLFFNGEVYAETSPLGSNGGTELGFDTESLKKSICVSNPDVEKMAHVANMYDGGDGYLYIPYFSSESDVGESITGDISLMVSKVATWDLHKKTIHKYVSKGQEFSNFTQSDSFAPYENPLIEVSATKYNSIFVATPQGGVPTMAVIGFTKKDMVFEDAVTLSTFKYSNGGTDYSVPMDTTNLSVFMDRILNRPPGTSNIGLYPIIVRAYKHNSDWYGYLGGMQSRGADEGGFQGCIVKTSDFGETWEYVSHNPNLSNVISCWEGSIEIKDNKIYTYIKATLHGGIYGDVFGDYAIFSVYNLATDTWDDAKTFNRSSLDLSSYPDVYYSNSDKREVQNSFDTSRVFLYKKNGFMYALCNVTLRMRTLKDPSGSYRSHVRIYKLDDEYNVLAKKSVLDGHGCHYFTIVNSIAGEFFCYTSDTRGLGEGNKGDIQLIPMDFINF